MSAFWKFLYYTMAFLAVNSTFFIIPYIIPGITQNDILPYQIFFVALGILNIMLPSNKSSIKLS